MIKSFSANTSLQSTIINIEFSVKCMISVEYDEHIKVCVECNYFVSKKQTT